jgi:predicted TIM-barrel enzyme
MRAHGVEKWIGGIATTLAAAAIVALAGLFTRVAVLEERAASYSGILNGHADELRELRRGR